MTNAMLQSGITTGVLPFYDAPEPPAGVFDDLLNIPFLSGSPRTKSYVEYFGTDSPSGR